MLHILIFPFMRAISSRELGFGKYILKEQVILGDIRPSQCLGIVIICKTRSGKSCLPVLYLDIKGKEKKYGFIHAITNCP